MAEGNGMKLSAFFSRSIHKCCMYYDVSTRTTQDSRSHLLNSQKQHVVAILDSLIFQWTSKAIACRWLIYLANNKHGKPRASRVKVLVIKSWHELFLWNRILGLGWFGPVWSGFDQFGPDWYFENYEYLVFLNLISSRYLVQINKRVMLLTFSYVSWTFNFLICRSVNGGWA